MFSKSSVKIGLVALAVLGSVATTAYAFHSWGNYHWARTANPFTLKLGDNMSAAWDPYLATASADWTLSSVLDTTIVDGSNLSNPRNCKPKAGRIEVCNAKYGYNGWLGVATIWISGSHITQATAKMNDTYFTLATYNTPAWKRLVVCQEIAHGFGLGHQDEIFNNANLGSCMDYTNDPDGGAGGFSATDPSNEHPNQHDYDQLETIYNNHLDLITTVGQAISRKGNHDDASEVADWGKSIQKDGKGRNSLYERDLGKGDKVFTFILWAE